MFHFRPGLLLLVALVFAGGCQRDTTPVSGTRGGFQVEEDVLDFGRVLEHDTASRTVTVVGTGRSSVTVTASVKECPFSLPQSEVSVPGAGSASLEVLFLAGKGPAEGTLVLSSAGVSREVPLRGEGVRPLACVPSAQCRESHFELEPGSCVESVAPDGTACIPDSRCQENGRCQSGVCVGSPRSCDDGNPCTRDACSPDQGCVTSPVSCPVPANPCHVGVCDRERGCSEVNVAELTACGKVDCVSSRLCFSGTCREVPTPEGTLCAPATPCQGEGHCGGGECVRPDAGELLPAFSQELGGEPVGEPGGPVLLTNGDALFASVCDGDAGCRLVSYTSNGFLRFEAPYPEGSARTLLAVSDAGVVVSGPGAIESYASAGSGASLWRVPLERLPPPTGATGFVPSTGAGRVALGPQGEVVSLVSWASPDTGDGGTMADAGATLVVLAPDGGVLREGPVGSFAGNARVALGSSGEVFLLAEGGPLARAEPDEGDAGFRTLPLLSAVPGGASLAVAGGRLFAGARTFMDSDGGSPSMADWDAGTTTLRPLDEPVLLLEDTGLAFARACPGTSCTPDEEGLVLRAFDARDGGVRWETPVLPDEAPGTLHEAALMRGGAVSTVTSSRSVEGTRAHIQVFAEGQRLMMCPLPGTPRVVGAAYSGRFVHVALERDGSWRLETFDLGSFATRP